MQTDADLFFESSIPRWGLSFSLFPVTFGAFRVFGLSGTRRPLRNKRNCKKTTGENCRKQPTARRIKKGRKIGKSAEKKKKKEDVFLILLFSLDAVEQEIIQSRNTILDNRI